MELQEIIESAGTCRAYRTDNVSNDVIAKVINAARFAPQGGNRQPVRFVVVRNEAKRRQLAEWYRQSMQELRKSEQEGLVGISAAAPLKQRGHMFADQLGEIPVLIVVCAEMKSLAVTDIGLGRIPVVGGASIYPAVQNLLLKAREVGLGVALTTILCAAEPQVKGLLHIPDGMITACLIAVGWPAEPFPKKLTRRPLSEISYLDTYGETFPSPD